jgi:hypothetical protein
MKKSECRRPIVAAVFLAIAMFSLCMVASTLCTQPLSEAGGFGSETTNGIISGTAVLPDGTPAVGARVTVRRIDYVSTVNGAPIKKRAATAGNGITDSAGRFTIDSLDTGSYTIEINDALANAVCGRCRIASKTPRLDFGISALMRYAAVRGEVGGGAALDKRYVQVVGFERLAAVDTSGSYALSDLPQGTFTLSIVCETAAPPVLLENIHALSGMVTTAPVTLWPHSMKITLNTSAAGAGGAGGVHAFPLLIRLTNKNFTFGKARKNGEDIRFAKSDGVVLPYEIEHWDSAGGSAALWVTVDTVRGNNDSQTIVMYWGAARAKDNADAAAVFDTANGFLAVWHLSNQCYDATSNAHNGTNYGAGDTMGMIGYCKKFRGFDSIKVPGLLDQPAVVTLSAWAQSDTVRETGGEIVSLGDDVLMRIDDKTLNNAMFGAIHTYGDSTAPVYFNVSSNRTLTKTGWHHIVFIADDPVSMQSVYIDGALCLRSYNKNAAIEYVGLGHNTFIGCHGDKKTSYNFTGRIDEVRICSVPRSADWIKLSYMNQKLEDALVYFH